MRIDLTTTSVGRMTVAETYMSFLSEVQFSGTFRLIVTVDPAYGVDAAEISETLRFLDALPTRFPQVEEVVIERFPRRAGLAGALGVLFAHAREPIGVHLEDDWLITDELNLDALISDLRDTGSTAIVFGNGHAGQGGTFSDPELAEPVPGTREPLVKLTERNWAARYLPLCPHLHDSARWLPTVARALAFTDPLRCPDERVRDRITAEGERDAHNVLWTRRILAEDIGRAWLAERGLTKSITPAAAPAPAAGTPPVRADEPLPLHRSQVWLQRAEKMIPGLTQTFQKRPENFAPGAYPNYLERGDGALVWDVDGTCYIDFICALGAVTLGHNHPAVTTTIHDRAAQGVLHSLPASAEVSLAEQFVAAVPGVEMVRFLKTGADACSAAVRLARHLTGRDGLLLAGYHGWHDHLAAGGPGVPASVLADSTRVRLDSPDDEDLLIDQVSERTAAVVLSTPYHRRLERGFLERLRGACDKAGALLVMDEIVTGFRLAPGGLGQLLNVPGDIRCFSKGLAAGLPLAAVGGSREVMRDFAALHVSTTFGGELLSLQVARAALREYARDRYYASIAALGHRLREGINGHAAQRGLRPVVDGYDPMPFLRLPAPAARAFIAAMARRGVLMRRGVNFVSAAHTAEQIDFAVAAAGAVLRDCADAICIDEGPEASGGSTR